MSRRLPRFFMLAAVPAALILATASPVFAQRGALTASLSPTSLRRTLPPLASAPATQGRTLSPPNRHPVLIGTVLGGTVGVIAGYAAVKSGGDCTGPGCSTAAAGVGILAVLGATVGALVGWIVGR